MQSKKIISPLSRAKLHDWLQRNHPQKHGVHIRVYKKHSPHHNLHPNDIAEEALFFGWCDNPPERGDSEYYLIHISPRKPEAPWSVAHKKLAEKFMQTNRIHPQGLNAIKIAQENGSWNANQPADKLEWPPLLKQMLRESPSAQNFLESLSTQQQSTILEWIYSTKRDHIRVKRIQETVEKASRNIRVK